MSDVVTPLLSAQYRLEEVRYGFEDRMQDAFNWVNPRRYDMSGTATQGAKRKTKMYDGVAQDAFLTWRDGIIGWFVGPAVTSAGPGWHKAALGNIRGLSFTQANSLRQDDQVKGYLQDYTDQMRYEFNVSNFYDVEGEWLQDLGSGGTGTVLTEESRDRNRALLRVPHPARYWIEENAEYEVDVYHEKLTLTARQCLQKYDRPDDTLPETIRKWAQDAGSANREVTLLQCIRPADDAIFDRRIKWSQYVLVTLVYEMSGGAGVSVSPTSDVMFRNASERLVRIEPLGAFSPTVCRLRKNSDELYGYSQAMDVLCVIEAANQHAFNLLDLGNFAAKPMLNVPDEKRTEFARLPGARFHYGSEKRLVSTVPMGGEYPIAIDREDKLHRLIYARYGYDLWRMMAVYQQKRERNQAYEVSEGRVDQARLMVSQTGNLWHSGFVPIYNAMAGIAGRARRLPEAPALLQDYVGQDVILVDPIGPLALLQELAATVSPLQQGLRFLADIAEIVGRHVSPVMAGQLYHRVNLPDLAEFALDKTGFPRKLMRSDEEVETRVQEDNRRALAQEQAQNAQRLAAASAQLGKPVDETSLLAGGVSA